ncbi:hypothetical protein MP228_005684 [Amoeboaphelidium protococcarum]|nr:hypothetical protein MP228_005684 [Amoeboaphelidium protococcarum]
MVLKMVIWTSTSNRKWKWRSSQHLITAQCWHYRRVQRQFSSYHGLNIQGETSICFSSSMGLKNFKACGCDWCQALKLVKNQGGTECLSTALAPEIEVDSCYIAPI